MRKLCVFMLLLGNLLLSIGCAPSKLMPSTPTQEMRQTDLATKIPQVTQVQGPIRWRVEILQNEKIVPANNGQTELAREPFTIRVKLPVLLNVKLNVFDKDTNFQQIIPGFVFPESNCNIVFCSGMSIVEDGLATSLVATSLVIDIEGTHYWFYDNETKRSRWSRVSIKDGEVILDRDVAFLNQKPISDTTYSNLYMVFWVDYREKQMVNEDEVNKVILMFR